MYGATIGQTCLLAMPATTNQACCAILPREDGSSTHFAYLFFEAYNTALVGLAQGAAQKNISQEVVKTFKMTLPSKMLLVEFDEYIYPIFKQIESL